MKVFKFTNASVDYLKEELKENFTSRKLLYKKGSGGFSVSEHNLKIVSPGEYILPEGFSLIEDNNGSKDFCNSKMLYEALPITPLEANDGRLWVYLSHIGFFNYAASRWGGETISFDTIIDRFFFYGVNSRITRTRNAISRLWWTAHLTVREEFSDDNDKKWLFTKTIFESQDLQVSLLERDFGSYQNVLHGFLEFYISNSSELNGKKIQLLAKFLNNYGGAVSLSNLSKEDVIEALSTYFKTMK
jgi:hypothetical protein